LVRDYEEATRMLKALRIEKGYKSTEFARKLNIDPVTYSKRENNPGLITVGFMKDLSEAFNVKFNVIRNIFFTN
jgi:DNA-binding helix-turn-helix protein